MRGLVVGAALAAGQMMASAAGLPWDIGAERTLRSARMVDVAAWHQNMEEPASPASWREPAASLTPTGANGPGRSHPGSGASLVRSATPTGVDWGLLNDWSGSARDVMARATRQTTRPSVPGKADEVTTVDPSVPPAADDRRTGESSARAALNSPVAGPSGDARPATVESPPAAVHPPPAAVDVLASAAPPEADRADDLRRVGLRPTPLAVAGVVIERTLQRTLPVSAGDHSPDGVPVVPVVPSSAQPSADVMTMPASRPAGAALEQATRTVVVSLPAGDGGGPTADGAAPAATPSFAYQDQLIGGDRPESESVAMEDAGPQPEGFRSTSIEFRSYSRHGGSTGFSESGLIAQHRRETLNWGDWLVEGSVRQADAATQAFAADQRISHRFTIRQIGMPMGRDWTMSNALGMFRSGGADAMGVGSRFNLPSTSLTGAGHYWQSPRTAVHLEHGELTQLDGYQGLGARRLDGTATVGALTRRIGQNWGLAVQGMNVRSRLDAGDYSALTGSIGYASTEPGWRFRAQFLSNDRGRGGQWSEVERMSGFHTTRAVVWRFDPALYWYHMLLTNGQRGVAVRHDFADAGRFWGLGVERNREDPYDVSRAGREVSYLSGNVGFRIDRSRSVGVNAQFRHVTPIFDDGQSVGQRYASVTVYGTRSVRDVNDRLQMAVIDSRGAARTRIEEFSWTRDILRGDDGTVGFTAGVARETQESGTRLRPMLGVSYSKHLSERSMVSGWLRYARDADRFSTNYTVSGTVQVSWALSRQWALSASGSLNHLAYDNQQPVFASLPTRVNERSLWLSLRWSQEGGTPYGLPGVAGRGAGTVSGVIWLDDNRDGVRQGTERPAAEVVVVLDGQYTATTGPDGRYEFLQVRTGGHRLRIDPSSVRLPWGVADERGAGVQVEARGITRRDMGLIPVGD